MFCFSLHLMSLKIYIKGLVHFTNTAIYSYCLQCKSINCDDIKDCLERKTLILRKLLKHYGKSL